jgi:hypothetical protein
MADTMSGDLQRSLSKLLGELVHGAADGGFILNTGDAGLLASLDRLSPADASQSSHGGATIAAHVDHVRYGLTLMNRWAAGDAGAFAHADWTTAWKTQGVSDVEWKALRTALRTQVDAWLLALTQPRDLSEMALDGVVASIAHLAYHLGAIRQIHTSTRGPRESG